MRTCNLIGKTAPRLKCTDLADKSYFVHLEIPVLYCDANLYFCVTMPLLFLALLVFDGSFPSPFPCTLCYFGNPFFFFILFLFFLFIYFLDCV